MSKYISGAHSALPSRTIGIKDLLPETSPDTRTPDGMYGFRCIVQTPEVVIKNVADNGLPLFDIEFEIPFDDDLIANEAEIKIYNLSETTKNKFAIGNSVDVTAGRTLQSLFTLWIRSRITQSRRSAKHIQKGRLHRRYFVTY